VKAFLLAAGVGSRLRPITDTTPKCMLEFDGRTLLDIWLDSLHKAGVDEVLVNLHHLAGVVEGFLRGRSAPPAVHTVFEPELLGSAGTLLSNRYWVEEEEFFLACNADNLTDFALGTLVEQHRASHAAATLSVFRAPDPSACGIVELDADGVVVGFVEKPSDPVSDLANAGMYVFDPSVLDEIEGRQPLDIGYDLLPRLVGRARAVLVDTYFRDIGTVDAYQTAKQEWDSRMAR
jgi:mannose-1-phosphate guanylyltransferase